MECQYCKKVLNSKIALTKHQKTTKYCLIIQGKATDLYKCPCGTAFTSKTTLTQHQATCGLTLKDKLQESYTINRKLTEKLQEAQNEINFLKKELA